MKRSIALELVICLFPVKNMWLTILNVKALKAYILKDNISKLVNAVLNYLFKEAISINIYTTNIVLVTSLMPWKPTSIG